MVSFAPSRSVDTDDVLFARHGELGRIRLNRPKAINALTHSMITAIASELNDWVYDASVAAVILEGSGEKGFCAGGDVRAIREAIINNDGDPAGFWAAEYRLNAMIADYPKPIIPIMHGVTMGGGVGLASHASKRLVTLDAKVAMPETGIGFFPDVGGLYLLSRAPGQLGTHLALTGLPIDAMDAIYCGLADHAILHTDVEQAIERLAKGDDVDELFPVSTPSISFDQEWIDECYADNDPAIIVARLRGHDNENAAHAASVIESRSPLSVAVTLEAIRRAKELSLDGVFEQDLTLGRAFVEQSDFVEGVRAVLVDRDNKPKWQHSSIGAVPRSLVESMFD